MRANLDSADAASLAAVDAAEAELRRAAQAAALARYERAEKALAFSRREAAQRAAAYRSAMDEILKLPDLAELESGHPVVHTSIKPSIPAFTKVVEGKVNAAGRYEPGKVSVPKSPPVSARGASEGSQTGELGWGSNLYLLPTHYHDDNASTQRLGKLAFIARFSSWVHPSSEATHVPSSLVSSKGPPTHSYAQAHPFPPSPKPKSPPSPRPKSERAPNPVSATPGRASRSARSPRKRSKSPSPGAGPSVPRKVFAALTPKSSSRSETKKRSGNILGQLNIKATELDTLPELIRAALHKRHVRVIDLFRQLDDDSSGTISLVEWVKAMREFGLQAPSDAIGAVFHSFDPDHSGTIEYAELHNLLIRSVQKHPRLAQIKMKAETAVPLRKKAIGKKDANVLGNVGKEAMAALAASAPLDETLPNLIRSVLKEKMVRVLDLFRQLDDDNSGQVSVFEFIKAMREFGIEETPNAIVAVFNSFDKDKNGMIEYKELDRLLRGSVAKHPKLIELKDSPIKSGAAKGSQAGERAGKQSPPKSPKSGGGKTPPKSPKSASPKKSGTSPKKR